MKYFYLYLAIGLGILSGCFNFFLFDQLLSSVPTFVAGLAATVIALLMFAMLFRLNSKENVLVWLLCTKISVLTTIGAIFMSQVASTNAQDTVVALSAAKEYKQNNVERDDKAQDVWVKANFQTKATAARSEMDVRVDEFVQSAKDLEEAKNGKALMQESLDKLPEGWGLGFMILFTLVIALVFDLGEAACVTEYRKIDEEDKERERASVGNREVIRPTSSTNSDEEPGRYDTGVVGDKGGRYFRVMDDITSGNIAPSVKPIRQKHRCNQETAQMYLAAMSEDGILESRKTNRGIEYRLAKA